MEQGVANMSNLKFDTMFEKMDKAFDKMGEAFTTLGEAIGSIGECGCDSLKSKCSTSVESSVVLDGISIKVKDKKIYIQGNAEVIYYNGNKGNF